MNFAFAILLAAQGVPSEKDALDLARKIEASIREDGSWFDRNFDYDTLFQRSFKGLDADPKRRDPFCKGIRSTFTLGKDTSEAIKEKGTYTLLRVRTVEGRVQALFRMLSPAGFNYHEFIFEASPQGGARMVDFCAYLAGEWASETFRRAFITMLASDPAGGKLLDNEYIKNLDKIQRMQRLRNEGKNAEVLRIFATLPATLQKDRGLLLIRCLAASDVGEKESLDAVEAMKKVHPTNPALAILSLGPYSAFKKFDQALASLDALDQATGGDPYLLYQRSEVQFAAGSLEKARQAAQKSIEGEKTLKDPHWMLVTISLREKKFAETARELAVLENELGIRIGDLTKVKLYAEFVTSREYADWMKSREK